GLATVMIGLLKYSVFGRRIYAIGNNPRAAFLSGAPVRLTLVGVYAFSGLTAGLAGILLAGYSNNPDLGMGDDYVLQSIAAVVIGGASLAGGRGRALGTLIGALVLAVIRNGLNLLNVSSFWQQVVIGLVIAVAVGI
ncbi:ABC transporter permease, partial [Klebsiella pneumoniae]|uniref:ABC transporter permease n=1 Tax=Klebsiella pneumoniae TaxID=573 RepID=UPI003A8BD83F